MRTVMLSFARERFRNILKLINSLADEVTEEKVHLLRVELKKVRFIVKSIRFYCPHVKIKKNYKPFKILFDELAKIRGEHVNSYRKSQSEPGEAEKDTRLKSKTVMNLENDLHHSLPGHQKRISNSINKLLTKLEGFPEIQAHAFAGNLIDGLFESLNADTSKKELHKNRHLLKGIIYASEMSETVATKLKERFDLNKILELEDAIGDWHDLSILIDKNKKKRTLSPKGLSAVKNTREKKLLAIYDLIENIHPSPVTV